MVSMSAVDQDHLARDEVAVVREEEDYCAGDVLGASLSSEGAFRVDGRLVIFAEIGLGEAGRQGVDVDVVRPNLTRQGAGQTGYRGLGDDVLGVASGDRPGHVQPDAGTAVDDLALSLVPHVGEDGARAEERPLDVHGHDPVPDLEVHVEEVGRPKVLNHARVVHEAIDAAEALESLSGHVLGLLLIGDVDAEG